MPIIELQKLVIQALNLGLLLIIYLSISHELQVAIYLAELTLVTRLPILTEREAKAGLLKILFDAILQNCDLSSLFLVQGGLLPQVILCLA